MRSKMIEFDVNALQSDVEKKRGDRSVSEYCSKIGIHYATYYRAIQKWVISELTVFKLFKHKIKVIEKKSKKSV
jgi:hypothetical protein